MDVRLSAEQQALRDSARQLADRLCPKAVGQLDDLDRAAKLDAAVAASGWRELRAAADGGRPLASGVEAAIVAEELGRSLADTAFMGPTLAVELRRLTGLVDAAAPETVVLEPDLRSVATASGVGPDHVAPDGVAVDARGAAAALLFAPSPSGPVPAEVAIAAVDATVDLTRPHVAVPAGAPITVLGDARPLSDDDLARWTALGLALTAADLVGTMAGAVRLASDYAADRRQFGTAIGSFQAVQHLLADAHVATEGARSATLHAAWAVDALSADEALDAASVAKAFASRAALGVCETAIQVHGGIGNTWECLAHVHLRRALLSSDVFGGAEASLSRVLAHRGITVGGGDGLR